MKRARALLTIVIGVPLLVALVAAKLGITLPNDPLAKSKDFGHLAEAQLAGTGHAASVPLNNVNCWPRYGGNPAKPADWDCAANDAVGNALTWGARVTGSHTDLSPIRGFVSGGSPYVAAGSP